VIDRASEGLHLSREGVVLAPGKNTVVFHAEVWRDKEDEEERERKKRERGKETETRVDEKDLSFRGTFEWHMMWFQVGKLRLEIDPKKEKHRPFSLEIINSLTTTTLSLKPSKCLIADVTQPLHISIQSHNDTISKMELVVSSLTGLKFPDTRDIVAVFQRLCDTHIERVERINKF